METPLNSNIAIGTRIRARRNELGLKQADVAKELGMTMQAISLWENGKVAPGGNSISTLARVLQCDVSWLLEGTTVDENNQKILSDHDANRIKKREKREIDQAQSQTLRSYIPEKYKDDIDFIDDLHNLLMYFCDLDESRRADVLIHTIEQWKDNAAEEIARADRIYKQLKDGM
ncbi:helix-turn-helix domain-containing protein [Phytobacter sp. RSE-02]|uniref:helix-turn-helix domain-containing protein n=1 Tax=Phytobacter sp. RSE-02 TaxID=3229229 RepID=UPI00339D4CF1